MQFQSPAWSFPVCTFISHGISIVRSKYCMVIDFKTSGQYAYGLNRLPPTFFIKLLLDLLHDLVRSIYACFVIMKAFYSAAALLFLSYMVVTIHVAGFQTVALFMQSDEAEKLVASIDSISDIVKDSPHKVCM